MNQKLFQQVLAKIKPSNKEMQEEQKISHELMQKIEKIDQKIEELQEKKKKYKKKKWK